MTQSPWSCRRTATGSLSAAPRPPVLQVHRALGRVCRRSGSTVRSSSSRPRPGSWRSEGAVRIGVHRRHRLRRVKDVCPAGNPVVVSRAQPTTWAPRRTWWCPCFRAHPVLAIPVPAHREVVRPCGVADVAQSSGFRRQIATPPAVPVHQNVVPSWLLSSSDSSMSALVSAVTVISSARQQAGRSLRSARRSPGASDGVSSMFVFQLPAMPAWPCTLAVDAAAAVPMFSTVN